MDLCARRPIVELFVVGVQSTSFRSLLTHDLFDAQCFEYSILSALIEY